MAPQFLPGDTIIIDPAIQPETGKFVIAKIDGDSDNGEATFKQFIRDGDRVYLKPLNDKFPLLEMTGKDFKIVGCVVEKRTTYWGRNYEETNAFVSVGFTRSPCNSICKHYHSEHMA